MRFDPRVFRRIPLTACLVATTLLGTASSVALAAPSDEITVVPLGNATIKKGVQALSFRLSGASQGQSVQPLVFIGAQPQLAAPAGGVEGENPPPAPQVPATLSIEIGGKQLPDWVLSPRPTAYVINVDTIRANPEFAAGRLLAKLNLKSDAEALTIAVLGMPDPVLLGGPNRMSLDGPLSEFARSAQQAEARTYFQAMIDEFAGRRDQAITALRALCDAGESNVSRFARRSMRRLAYLERETKLTGNFLEHYRWGLYLQFCGLYRPAYDEFEECRVIYPMHADSQYRAGECFEMIGSDLIGLLQYIDRCETASPTSDATRLDVLAVIMKASSGTTLSDEDIVMLMDHLSIARKMIAAATSNAVRVEFTVQIVNSEDEFRIKEYANGISGPAPDKFEREGWFDGVIVIRPSAVGASAADVRVSPPGAGPRGASIATASHNARWSDFVEIAYQMMADAGRRSGAMTTLPPSEDAVSVGMAPSPQVGFSCRSALRYLLPRNAYAGVGVADLPLEESFLRTWRLDGPFSVVSGDSPAGLFENLPVTNGDTGKAMVFNDSNVSFESIVTGGASGRLRASCWVYVPNDQLVQLRTDQAHPLGVRVNGRIVRRGAEASSVETAGVYAAFAGIKLRKGWNTVEVVTRESNPIDASAFKASMLSVDGRPIGGFAVIHTKPDGNVVALNSGWSDGTATFDWKAVRDDWRRELPLLDLAEASGEKGLTLTSDVAGRFGHVAIAVPGRRPCANYRTPPTGWNKDSDRDVVFNNVLDWHREWCFAIDVDFKGKHRQLLFARPEALDAIAYCLKEDPAAAQRFNNVPPMKRLLGRVEIPGADCDHDLIVFDVWLGDESSWPIEEEDLLSPFGEFVTNEDFIGIVNPLIPVNPLAPASGPSNAG
ncbi:MAG: hypothetical protein H6818_02900 [Phycisphaerales bacterium]|nr:hypothetical protein [Phycisphaerales bacterium]MCB9864671.1 hypothetical protein [Phycisphaerales bacterium]